MSKALYREYRPQTFNEVLGQDRVVNVLKNQVKSGKISHAYLFAGERGTGKTTCAKIFAKAVNCLNPKDGSPCLECENCIAIDEESTIDIVEMDAASNRRIDDIRNLKDNVIYPPNTLKYKVYIIDEAHMITREAFNALLKIMEEPPKHLIFILATTEIEKIPKTILSRVQKFEFNKIDENQIKKQINIVLKDKNIEMENEAIDLIIRKANGAMRDALSILDQIISFDKDKYIISDIEAILGVVDFYDVDNLLTAIINKDQKSSLEILFKLRDNNKSNNDIIDSLINYLRDILIFKLTDNENLFENQDRINFIKEKSSEIKDTEITDYIDILNNYLNKMKLSENSDILLEVAIVRLINLKDINSLESRIDYLEKNTEHNVIDLVNKVITQKLRSLDLNSADFNIIDTKFNSNELQDDEKSKDAIEDKESKEKITNISIEDKNKKIDNQQLVNDLSKTEENLIIDMLINTAGGMLKALFQKEGFNYKIEDEQFTIYIKEDFYRIFIETKNEIIEKNLANILDKEYKFNVDSYINREDTKKVDREKNKDNSQKLKEVFGDDLIIE